MENCIKDFMEKNSLTVGEEFITSEGEKYFFDDMYYLRTITFIDGDYLMAAQHELVDLLVGADKIEKLPFRPKLGQWYWTYSNTTTTDHVVEFEYMGDLADALRIKNNFAFRTREEAEDPKNIARLKEYLWRC